MKRCIREYGWSDKFATRVLESGYKKFLQLKKDLSDWDHKILSPSIPVDKMWHMHILDIANYIKDCELLCGHLVGHDPDGMLNDDARKRRVETTKHILRNQLGGEMDEEVWNFGSGGDTSSAGGCENKVGSDNESPFRKRRRIKEDTTDDDDGDDNDDKSDDGHFGESKGNATGDSEATCHLDDSSWDRKRRQEGENTGKMATLGLTGSRLKTQENGSQLYQRRKTGGNPFQSVALDKNEKDFQDVYRSNRHRYRSSPILFQRRKNQSFFYPDSPDAGIGGRRCDRGDA